MNCFSVSSNGRVSFGAERFLSASFASSECCTETKGQAQGLRLLHQVHVKAVEHLRNTHILPTH